jgi:signal transduction histidine kinase
MERLGYWRDPLNSWNRDIGNEHDLLPAPSSAAGRGGICFGVSLVHTKFCERSRIQVTLEFPPDLDRLPETVEVGLFNALQEALENGHRHA